MQLKNLANNCNFGTAYDSSLCDQLFMTIDDQSYFEFLMSEDLELGNMTLEQLLERIFTLEKAHMGKN